MSRFLFNLSDHEARKKQVTKVRTILAERQAAAVALEQTFDPEVAKSTDDPFPEELASAPESETPVSDSPEAPVEAAAEEDNVTPVRLCSVCREPGHTKAKCPTLVTDQPEEGEVSESDTGDETAEQTAE